MVEPLINHQLNRDQDESLYQNRSVLPSPFRSPLPTIAHPFATFETRVDANEVPDKLQKYTLFDGSVQTISDLPSP